MLIPIRRKAKAARYNARGFDVESVEIEIAYFGPASIHMHIKGEKVERNYSITGDRVSELRKLFQDIEKRERNGSHG